MIRLHPRGANGGRKLRLRVVGGALDLRRYTHLRPADVLEKLDE